eukprot:g25199.t1
MQAYNQWIRFKLCSPATSSDVKSNDGAPLSLKSLQPWSKELDSRGEMRGTAFNINAVFLRMWHQGALGNDHIQQDRVYQCSSTFSDIIVIEHTTIKLLGVSIDQKLNKTSHIDTVATGA